jgi:tetratricopeptide (TPR) repeat protein
MNVASRHLSSRTRRRGRVLLALAALLIGCGAPDPVARVRELQAAGSFGESLEPLRGLLEDRPEDPEVHYLYGVALLRSGQPSLAVWSLRKAMETPEWLVPAGLELALAALAADNHQGAIETVDRVLEAEPDHVNALLLRARARLLSRTAYEGALADADRVLELDPESLEALVPRAVALLGLERAEDAGVVISELERRYREGDMVGDQVSWYCAIQATFTKEKGDIEAAEQLYDECLEASPASPVVVEQAIQFYNEQERPERVMEILRAALQEAPLAGGYRRALATRLRQAGEVEEAEQLLLEGTELKNREAALGAWVDLGDHYLQLEDHAGAASALESAIALLGTPNPDMLFSYADVLVMAGRYDRALEVASEMQLPAHRELVEARVLLARGQPGEALKHFAAGLRLWPDNAVARYYAAIAAEGVGAFDRAIAEYRYSIRSDPAATDARVRLARLHEAEGRDQLALAVVGASARAAPEPELDWIAVRVTARLGRPVDLSRYRARLAGTHRWGSLVAAAAEGLRDRRGAAEAAQMLREFEWIDLSRPRNAAALRALVVFLAEAGDPDGALEVVGAGLAAHPDAPVFHGLRGLALERGGAPAEEVRAAYQRALELAPEWAEALAGLARLAADAGDPEAALDLTQRAVTAKPGDASILRALAELLVSLDRREEAEQRLAELLEEDPYDAGAAARLAELRLEREAEPDRTLALARGAVRFGGGPEAYELLARVHRQRGEPELADEAARRAEEARVRAGGVG